MSEHSDPHLIYGACTCGCAECLAENDGEDADVFSCLCKDCACQMDWQWESDEWGDPE